MNDNPIEGESLGETTERTIYELNNDLRRRVLRHPVLAAIFEKHGRQLTTSALYELAIALDNENQQLAVLAIKHGARSLLQSQTPNTPLYGKIVHIGEL
jgi:hypothetical protein